MAIAEEMDTVTGSTAGTVDRHDTAETFESTSPGTGAVVGVFPVHDADAVAATVARARPAAERWAALGFGERKLRLAACPPRAGPPSAGGSPAWGSPLTGGPSPAGSTSWPTWCTGRTASRTPTRS